MTSKTDSAASPSPAASAALSVATNQEAPAWLYDVSPAQLAQAIQQAGCAVTSTERDGVTHLHSAAHGIGFQVLWGNPAAGGTCVDFTFSCPLRVQGGLAPDSLLAEWHRSKRFARVSQHGGFVVLEMDVIVAGGVAPDHLRLACVLWTQMMGEFFVFLRNHRPAEPVAEGAVA